MNEMILLQWIETKRIFIEANDLTAILFFVKYMDKHSLRLNGYEKSSLSFTNDAQEIDFSHNDMKRYVSEMKKGCPFPWENFEEN